MIAPSSKLTNPSGSVVTTPFAALVSDKWGRRAGMTFGAVIIILGSVIAASSFSLAQVTVGRFVLGSGIQFMTVAAPAYSMEVAPPQWRGRATGFYNCGWFGGAIPAALVTFGTQYIDSTWSWRIPFIGQCFACIIVLCAVWFLPESPRYLFSQGREKEAVDFLVKYHGGGNPESRLVQLQVEEIRASVQEDLEDRRIPWWDFRVLFNTREARWRTAQVAMMGIFGQYTGNGLGYFNPLIFSQIGIETTAQQLGFNILGQCLQAIGAGTAVTLTDRMPRRKVLVIGTFICAVMLAINGATSHGFDQSNKENKSMGQAALAFYFLFNIVYSFTYTPLQGVVPVEALDNRRRAKGLAFYGFLTGCFGFVNTYCTPEAYDSISYNYIWVFVGWDCIETACWYFFGYVPHISHIHPSIKQKPETNLPSPVSRLKAVPSRNSTGSTSSPTPSRPPSRSTRSSSRLTEPSPRRSSTTMRELLRAGGLSNKKERKRLWSLALHCAALFSCQLLPNTPF
jgi:sugar porter (SP) family MFS transporter